MQSVIPSLYKKYINNYNTLVNPLSIQGKSFLAKYSKAYELIIRRSSILISNTELFIYVELKKNKKNYSKFKENLMILKEEMIKAGMDEDASVTQYLAKQDYLLTPVGFYTKEQIEAMEEFNEELSDHLFTLRKQDPGAIIVNEEGKLFYYSHIENIKAIDLYNGMPVDGSMDSRFKTILIELSEDEDGTLYPKKIRKTLGKSFHLRRVTKEERKEFNKAIYKQLLSLSKSKFSIATVTRKMSPDIIHTFLKKGTSGIHEIREFLIFEQYLSSNDFPYHLIDSIVKVNEDRFISVDLVKDSLSLVRLNAYTCRMLSLKFFKIIDYEGFKKALFNESDVSDYLELEPVLPFDTGSRVAFYGLRNFSISSD